MVERPNPLNGIEPATEQMVVALRLLIHAYDCASRTGCDLWQFAVEMSELAAQDVTRSDMRMLLVEGLVEHGKEVAVEDSGGRIFRSLSTLRITNDSCFVLSEKGIERFALRDQDLSGGNGSLAHHANGAGNDHITPIDDVDPNPHWNVELRELWVGELLVKRFRRPAPVQELILSVFEEESWPIHIDDPLPPSKQDTHVNLHEAVKRLNRNHLARVIRFHGDGTGEGISWTIIRRDQIHGHDPR